MLSAFSFNGKAELYDKFRPIYSERYINLLSSLGIEQNSCLADVGAGTGKHSATLLKLSAHLYCIEPNPEMLSICRRNLNDSKKDIRFICSSAESMPIPNNSIHFITVAQAFHLFDPKKCLCEFSRVLTPNGKVIITWQSKNPNTSFFTDTEKVISKYCPSYNRQLHVPRLTPYSYENFFPNNSFDYYYFGDDNYEEQTEEIFLGRTLSASYSLTPNDENYRSYVSSLQEVFHEHSCNGVICSSLSTIVYIGSLN